MVMLAACGGHAADVADTARRPTPTTTATREPLVDAIGSTGADSDSTAGPTSSSQTASPTAKRAESTTTVTEPPLSITDDTGDVDALVANRAVLTASDLPGWRSEPMSSATDPSTAALPSECRYLASFRGRVSETTHASATFVHPDDLAELSNTVIVHADVDSATSAFEVVDRRETARCLEMILVGDGGPFTIDRASVTRVVVARADAGVRFDAELSVIVDGTSYAFAAQFTYVRVGRSISQSIGFGTEGIPGEADAALDAVTARLSEFA